MRRNIVCYFNLASLLDPPAKPFFVEDLDLVVQASLDVDIPADAAFLAVDRLITGLASIIEMDPV
mgnify:CR=1 FL=1